MAKITTEEEEIDEEQSIESDEESTAPTGRKNVISHIGDHLELDLGLLQAYDSSPMEKSDVNEDFLKKQATANMDLLLSGLFKTAKQQNKVSTVALPKVETPLPRAKPLPKPKIDTRWQKYAQGKGIQNKKRDKNVYDPETRTWKPRFGYQSARNDRSTNWVEELKEGDDPTVDKFAEKRESKKLKVMKNEKNQLRNRELQRDFETAQKATASLGNFDKRRKDEPKVNKHKGQRRDRNEMVDSNIDRDRKILERVLNKA